MSRFLVAGVLQIETIVRVEEIPVNYRPVTSKPDTIYTDIGGDAYNEAIALKWLGNEVDFISMVGKERNISFVNPPDSEVKLDTDYVLQCLNSTPTAVIFSAPDRKSQIFEDTKDAREVAYDMELFEKRLQMSNWIVLANNRFCVPFIEKVKAAGKPLAVNVKDFSTVTREFNYEFMKAADVIYVSDDDVSCDPFDFVNMIADACQPEIIILGQGRKGVILYSKSCGILAHYNTVKTNKTINTVGAGNALFSCFLHYYDITKDPVYSIKNAILFASYKVGFMGTSHGFMSVEQIEQWRSLIWKDEQRNI